MELGYFLSIGVLPGVLADAIESGSIGRDY